jgi:hypothetical protein
MFPALGSVDSLGHVPAFLRLQEPSRPREPDRRCSPNSAPCTTGAAARRVPGAASPTDRGVPRDPRYAAASLLPFVRSGRHRQPEPGARVLGGRTRRGVSGPASSELARPAARDALSRHCARPRGRHPIGKALVRPGWARTLRSCPKGHQTGRLREWRCGGRGHLSPNCPGAP